MSIIVSPHRSCIQQEEVTGYWIKKPATSLPLERGKLAVTALKLLMSQLQVATSFIVQSSA
jgi:hypothetical protein